jgi:hypothetical protein
VAANWERDEGRVLMELAGADGTLEVHEVGFGERWTRRPFRPAA